MLLAFVVACSAVFHMFSMLRDAMSFLIIQKGCVMPTVEPSQVDSVFTVDGGLGRVDVWGSRTQQFVAI